MKLRTCVAPEGRFIFSVHKSAFTSANLRASNHRTILGETEEGRPVENSRNLPLEDVTEENDNRIYEIPNPFPFRGATYIGKAWADRAAKSPGAIAPAQPKESSLTQTLKAWLPACGSDQDSTPQIDALFARLPRPLLLALATTSTDPDDLIRLARLSGRFIFASDDITPTGMRFRTDADGIAAPVILDHDLFEATANNSHLPDIYKKIMVLAPGIQGGNEIMGEWRSENNRSHVYEYLRRNSYIPFGHYAANMADDCVCYSAEDLLSEDICGMRHLYYQRTYVRLAEELGLSFPFKKRTGTIAELETLREKILVELKADRRGKEIAFNRTLWGWNFGFDFSPTGYRLHGSHQQVHQQFALISASAAIASPGGSAQQDQLLPAYAHGDLIAAFIAAYRREYGVSFFSAYEKAIRTNQRIDNNPKGPHQLVVHEDEHVLLFAPKAQTSQWELQLMPKRDVGNIVAADTSMRASLDQAVWVAMRTLGAMGARMITVIESSGKISGQSSDQRILYSFLPRLPQSPGSFIEAQLRWINGHYPEDFAAACRAKAPKRPANTA